MCGSLWYCTYIYFFVFTLYFYLRHCYLHSYNIIFVPIDALLCRIIQLGMFITSKQQHMEPKTRFSYTKTKKYRHTCPNYMSPNEYSIKPVQIQKTCITMLYLPSKTTNHILRCLWFYWYGCEEKVVVVVNVNLWNWS